MSKYLLRHVPDELLAHGLSTLVERDRTTTAQILAHIAEFDERKLFASTCSSMKEYCVRILRFSEDAAFKRIQAARAARDFPVLFEAVADGRLHLTAVGLLAPHLAPENLHDLLRAAAGRTKSEIKELLARRFPSNEEIPIVEALPTSASLAPAQVEGNQTPEASVAEALALAPAQVAGSVTGPRSRTEPIAAGRYALHLSMGRETFEKLEALKALLAPQIPSGDLSQVLDRAMEVALRELRKRKYGVGVKPRARRATRSSRNTRHLPASVREQVWRRDGGQCTFVGEDGRRCVERRVEFDHVQELARGGEATVENLRLRCRTHNQLEARRTYGAEFMRRKRDQARRESAERKQSRRVAAAERAARKAIEADPDLSINPWLRGLGFPLDRARALAARCEDMAGATIEERVATALRYSTAPASIRRGGHG